MMVNRVRHNVGNMIAHAGRLGQTSVSLSLPLLFLSPFSLSPTPSLVLEGQHIETLCCCCCCCRCTLVPWERTALFSQGLGSSFLLTGGRGGHRWRLMQERKGCKNRRCVNYHSSSGHLQITCFLAVFCQWRS